MAFNSLRFLIFFPVVLLLYYSILQKWKNVWLLICSYFFYACWNVRYCLLLLVCTLLSYFAAIIVEKRTENTAFKKKIFILGVLSLVGMLSIYKYSNFALENVSRLLEHIGMSSLPQLDIVMPVGISFFTFQALGYLIDVYFGKMSAERSFVTHALFVSFFPQLLSGPIGRADKLLPQYRQAKTFSYEKVRNGFSLGGSRCSKTRHYFNILIVFLVSGLWHGAKWSFVAWGLLHGLYQVSGNVFAPYRRKLCEQLGIRTDTAAVRLWKIFVTFALVDFAWLFFRADGLMNALKMCKRILLELHPLSLMNGRIYELGLDRMNLCLLLYGIAFLLLTDILHYRGVKLRTSFRKTVRAEMN